MGDYERIGGVIFGAFNASWPFGKLAVSEDELTVSAKFFGGYTFSRSDVISIDKSGVSGVKIVHARSDCPDKIAFFVFGGANGLLKRIDEAGFVPDGTASPLGKRGNPFKWRSIIAAFLVWNLLFIPGILSLGSFSNFQNSFPNPWFLLPLLCAFVVAWVALLDGRFARMILKEGRVLGEVKHFFKLILFVSGFMIIGFSCMMTLKDDASRTQQVD